MFFCVNCKTEFKKWLGQCPDCKEWNSLEELADEINNSNISASNKVNYANIRSEASVVKALDVEADKASRFSSGDDEFNNVLGGGFVIGSVNLIGGDPGVGKSTLLMKIASLCQENGQETLYVSGEESSGQVGMRFHRMKLKGNVSLSSTSDLLSVIKVMKKHKYDLLIIDSIQTMFLSTLDSKPGSSAQVQACAMEIIGFCKEYEVTVVIIGHITKEGNLAGPKILEHMVDSVMYFEGDKINRFRILRSLKNRFGSTNEIGIFQINEDNIESVANPSMFFLDTDSNSGGIVFPAIEGSRAVIAEVESLVAPSYIPVPRRTVIGWDANRLAMILAVISSKNKVYFSEKDVYLSFAGGFKSNETANDLSVAISVTVSVLKRQFKSKFVVFGEICLSGKVRNVSWFEKRMKEALKMGYKDFIVPGGHAKELSKYKDINFYKVDSVFDLKNLIYKISDAEEN